MEPNYNLPCFLYLWASCPCLTKPLFILYSLLQLILKGGRDWSWDLKQSFRSTARTDLFYSAAAAAVAVLLCHGKSFLSTPTFGSGTSGRAARCKPRPCFTKPRASLAGAGLSLVGEGTAAFPGSDLESCARFWEICRKQSGGSSSDSASSLSFISFSRAKTL